MTGRVAGTLVGPGKHFAAQGDWLQVLIPEQFLDQFQVELLDTTPPIPLQVSLKINMSMPTVSPVTLQPPLLVIHETLRLSKYDTITLFFDLNIDHFHIWVLWKKLLSVAECIPFWILLKGTVVNQLCNSLNGEFTCNYVDSPFNYPFPLVTPVILD